MSHAAMQRTPRAQAGFTLLETLTVVAIIGVAATFAIPAVLNYMRNYRIRSATQELASAVQDARTKAIMKSSNWGVVFAVQDTTTFWVHAEDDAWAPGQPRQGARQQLNITAPDLQQSRRYQLPPSIVFANAAQCTPAPAPSPAFNPADPAIRFTALGTSCDPSGTSGACPTVSVASGTLTNLIDNRAANSILCLRDTRTGLSRIVTIDRGGRVEVQR
jgi:prepilin-type N-terminal cleavage/methylation domain-containing protein